MRWALCCLLLLASGCFWEDCEWWDQRCRDRRDPPPPPPGPPSEEGALASEEAIRLHAPGLPRLLDALGAPGPATIDWPGGTTIQIEVAGDLSFANDAARDGFSFRGAAVRGADGSFTDGWLEIDGFGILLRFEEWQWSAPSDPPLAGRMEVRGEGATGLLQLPGDGLAYYSGSYREPDTTSIPVTFTVAITPPG